jgi:predicted HTH domain antitoxin
MVETTLSQEELARKMSEIVERVQHGELAVVESFGKEQVVLLDALDFRLLRVLAACAADAGSLAEDIRPAEVEAVRDYLAEKISLGKAAELLHLSRFELMDHFQRLGVPLRSGPATLQEARAEVAAALKHRS